MPVKYDPALRTPERIRAVAGLYWLGVAELLFAVATMTIGLFSVIPTRMSAGLSFSDAFSWYIWRTVLPVSFDGIGGIFAVAAGTGICRRRWWGLWLGFAAIYFSLGKQILYGVSLVDTVLRGDILFIHFHFYFNLFHLCVTSVLAIMALDRCLRLYKTERRSV